MNFKSFRSAAFGAAIFSAVPVAPLGAQPVSFAFDPATCEFGSEIDALFDELQAEYDRGADQAGKTFATAAEDEEALWALRVSRPVELTSSGLTITGLALRDTYRWVYFADPSAAVASALERQNPSIAYSEDEGFGDGNYHAGLSDTASSEDQAYDEEETVSEQPELEGNSFLYCDLHPFLREARTIGKTAEEMLRFEPDPAIWTPAIDTAHSAAIASLDAASFDDAEAHARAAVEALQTEGASETEEYAQALWRLGQALSGLGREREAFPILQRALDLSAAVIGPRHIRTTAILRDLALTRSTVMPSGRSLDMVLYTTFEFSDLLGEDHPLAIRADNDFGRATMDYFAADLPFANAEWAVDILRDSHRKAQRVLGNDHPATADGLLHFAVALDAAGQTGAAYFNANEVFRKRYNLYGPDYLPTLEAMSRVVDYGLRQDAGNDRIAVLAGFGLRQALARRQRLSGSLAGEAQLVREARLTRAIAERFLEAAWWTRETAPERIDEAEGNAFYAAQLALAGSTDRAVAQAGARQIAARAGSEMAELADRREALAQEWASAETRIVASFADKDADPEQRNVLIARRDAIEGEMSRIDEALRAGVPQFFALLDDEPLDANGFYEMIGTDEAVLFLVPTDYGTHAMMISQDFFAWHRSPLKRKDIARKVHRLLWDVGANVDEPADLPAEWGPDREGRYPFDRDTAYELYRELIEPVLAAAEGKSHLFVNAGGSLSSIPLDLLVTTPPQGSDSDPQALRDTAWLADRFALVYAPSLRALHILRSNAETRPGGAYPRAFVGFGDPVLSGRGAARGAVGERRSGPGKNAHSRNVLSGARGPAIFAGTGSAGGERLLADVEKLRALSRLPGTAREIAALAAAKGASLDDQFLNHRATETQFRNADLSGVEVVAIATHGLLAGEIDGASEPGLVFTPPSASSETDDGLLTASEIAGMAIAAEWIILSACNTAAGDGSEGAPGLSGLARSFFFAGSRNLLASHWPVLDAVAPRLTVRTLELLQDNPAMSRAEAFRDSVREVRSDGSHDNEEISWAHPAVWAPFILIGDR